MRRVLSPQAGRALFGSVPRILTVVGLLVAYFVAAMWVEPFVPWWVVTLAGLLLLALLLYLGARWLDRDILRGAQEDSRER